MGVSAMPKDDKKVAAPPSPPQGKGGAPKRKKPPPDWLANVSRLQKHFALIYETKAVFDGERRIVVGIDALRCAYRKAVTVWLDSPDRVMIGKDEVVFDPIHADIPYNLFGGLESQPVAGKYDLVLELLDHICADRRDVVDWVLDWVAYMLQNVGAKMSTAIVMRGPQGCGKNMFWNVLLDIFGKYGGIITQSELESQYNDWASGKLLLIGNEVLSRREKWQLGGKLKNMITEGRIPISAKYMSTRYENNHCNMVFLSNDLLPVPLEERDRRFLVISTPGPHPEGKEFYQRVTGQIENGGREAFHDFLLKRDISHFDPHTKPPRTEDFVDAVELSLSPAELFIRRWKAGELECMKSGDTMIWAAASADIYALYKKWCDAEGERHIDSATWFGMKLKEAGFTPALRWIKVDGKKTARRVYHLEGKIPDSCEDSNLWVQDMCNFAYEKAHPTSKEPPW